MIEVLPGKPAEQAGLEDGDTITRIDGEPITDWEQMRTAIKRRTGRPMRVEIQRGGRSQTVEVTPNDEGAIGVKPVTAPKPMGLGRATVRAAIEPMRVVHALVTGLVRISTGVEAAEFVGSGQVAREIDKASDRGPGDAIYMVALLCAYVWPGFVLLELVLAAAMWRDRRQQPPELAGRP